MKIFEIAEHVKSKDYFSIIYPQNLLKYNTLEIIEELKNFIKDKLRKTWITSPILYSNYLNWENIPSETKMNKWIHQKQFTFININPHSLISYQREVVADIVLFAIENPQMGINSKKDYNRFPIVKQWNGKNYLIDGNHRAVAALWSNKLLKCRCLMPDIFFDVEPF